MPKNCTISLLPRIANAQSGQALTLGLSLSALALIALISSFNIGQLVHDKYSLRRAADAAVYSAALTQARAMNMHAYLNRAQIAHIIAMKHLVVLGSAEKFRATQASRSMLRNPPATLIGSFFGSQYAAAYLAARVAGPSATAGLAALEQAFNTHDQTVRLVLQKARIDQLKYLASMTRQRLEAVLIANIGDSGSSMRGETLLSLGLKLRVVQDDLHKRIGTQSVTHPEWQSMLTQAVEPYDYLRDRNYSASNYWAINIRCPHMQHVLRRKGQVSYDSNGLWHSSDSLSFHAVRFNKLIGCYQREYPMGWAFLQTGHRESADDLKALDIPRNFSEQSFWRWVSQQKKTDWNIFNGTNNQLAKGWGILDSISWQSHLPKHYVSIKGGLSKPVKIGIEVKQSAVNLRTSAVAKAVRTAGNLLFNGLDPEDVLVVEATAETYFSRPHTRLDGRHEIPNLFHPYWQARLSNTLSD